MLCRLLERGTCRSFIRGLIRLDSPREIDRGKKAGVSRGGENVETRPRARENRTRCLVHSGTVSPFYRACHERPNFRLFAVGPPNINQIPFTLSSPLSFSLSFSFSPSRENYLWSVALRDKPGKVRNERSFNTKQTQTHVDTHTRVKAYGES